MIFLKQEVGGGSVRRAVISLDAAEVNDDGWVGRNGSRVDSSYGGVRPALHLNLSSSNLFSYAGTVSADGTKNEVPYNTRTRLVQN